MPMICTFYSCSAVPFLPSLCISAPVSSSAGVATPPLTLVLGHLTSLGPLSLWSPHFLHHALYLGHVVETLLGRRSERQRCIVHAWSINRHLMCDKGYDAYCSVSSQGGEADSALRRHGRLYQQVMFEPS